MAGLQNDILEIMLKSQLMIERAGQKRLAKQQMSSDSKYFDERAFLISLQDAKCEEIERQLNILAEQNAL